MLRLVIGMTNYTGIACGVSFEKSIGQNVPEDWTTDHIQVRRLLALFPGSTAEEAEADTKLSPSVGAEDEKVRANLTAAVKADETEEVVEDVVEDVVGEEAEVELEAEPEEPEEPEEPGAVETTDERIARLVEEYSRDQLIDWAEEIGATHATKATKLDIAREIVEKEV